MMHTPMSDLEWERLEEELQPTGPQQAPLAAGIAEKHARLLELRPKSSQKDRIRDPLDEHFCFDVALVLQLIERREIQPKTIDWPTSYAKHFWGVCVDGEVVSQDEFSNLDLIWVLRMPVEHASTPCLVFGDDTKNILDGAHRIARAYLDGKQFIDALLVSEADVQRARKGS